MIALKNYGQEIPERKILHRDSSAIPVLNPLLDCPETDQSEVPSSAAPAEDESIPSNNDTSISNRPLLILRMRETSYHQTSIDGGYKELKLRVKVKLKLNILKMSVGIVIVAKLNAHTKTRVNPTITDAIRRNIQPNMPCEGAASVDEVAEVRILLASSVT